MNFGQVIVGAGESLTALGQAVGDSTIEVAVAHALSPALAEMKEAILSQFDDFSTRLDKLSSTIEGHGRKIEAQGRKIEAQSRKIEAQGRKIDQVCEQMKEIQEDVLALKWTQANTGLRSYNASVHTGLRALHKECSGGAYPIGALPPDDIFFPESEKKLFAMTSQELAALAAFYNKEFGTSVAGKASFKAFLCGELV